MMHGMAWRTDRGARRTANGKRYVRLMRKVREYFSLLYHTSFHPSIQLSRFANGDEYKGEWRADLRHGAHRRADETGARRSDGC